MTPLEKLLAVDLDQIQEEGIKALVSKIQKSYQDDPDKTAYEKAYKDTILNTISVIEQVEPDALPTDPETKEVGKKKKTKPVAEKEQKASGSPPRKVKAESTKKSNKPESTGDPLKTLEELEREFSTIRDSLLTP